MVTPKIAPKFPNANPKGHTVALVVFVSFLCLSTLPNIASSIDDVATIHTCTTPLFIEWVSRSTLGWLRFAISVIIFAISMLLMTETYRQELTIHYLESSKLRRLPIKLQGIKTQGFFTSWSWNILGLSFLLSALLTLHVDHQLSSHDETEIQQILEELSSQTYMKIALRASFILFEIAAPVSMLVSAVVRYVIWPKSLKAKKTDTLKSFPVLLQHNANIIFSLIEMGLLGSYTVRFTDMAVAPLFGLCYVLFAWSMKHVWLESGEPQFLYFFLDTTLGKGSTIALFALLVVLMLFYAIFVLVDDILAFLGGGVMVHFITVFGISSLLCRFRD